MEPFFGIKDINPQASHSFVIRTEPTNKFTNIFDDEEQLNKYKPYLADTSEAENLAESENLFNLTEQSVIDEDCEEIIDELDISDESEQKTISLLRTVITVYRKLKNENYRRGNGWVPLLSRLIKEKPKKLEALNEFKRKIEDFVPQSGTHGYVLHLLLMYHDPELSSLIDKDGIPIDKLTGSWINSLFAGTCIDSVLTLLWAYIFKDDPYRIFFIILSIIVSKRAKIFEMRFDAKKKIEDTIKLFPRFMDVNEIKEIISSASIFDMNTPPYFKNLFKGFMFGRKREKRPLNLPRYLPSGAFNVIESINKGSRATDFHYFIVDCRTQKIYDSGRFIFKNNLHIDCNLVTEWSSAYLNAILKTLISKVEDYTIQEPNKVKHICIMGSGLENNDPCVETIITSLLQKNIKNISILFGGFKAVHQLLNLNDRFRENSIQHAKEKCVYCNPALLQTVENQAEVESMINQPGSSKIENMRATSLETGLNLPGRVKQRLRQTGQDIKSQFMACVNPASSSCEDTSKEMEDDVNYDDNIYQEIETPYGNQSVSTSSDIYGVFNLNDITTSSVSLRPDELLLEPQFKSVLIDQWVKTPDVEKVFKCKEILPNGRTYASRLIITRTHIILLRRIDRKSKNKALLVLNCPIVYILKISGSSKNNDFLTITLDMSGIVSLPYEKVKLLMPGKEKFINLINKKFEINK